MRKFHRSIGYGAVKKEHLQIADSFKDQDTL